jgi:hypothetical protein
MTTLPDRDERVRNVQVTADTLSVDLMDGRTIRVPIIWFPRLADGTARQRNHWQVIAAGRGIHWPDLDEDISVAGLLRGTVGARAKPPARPSKQRTDAVRRKSS